MFDDSSKPIEVSIRRPGGATIRGSLSRGNANSSLEDILYREIVFLDFASKDGQLKFISKHQIAYVEPAEPLRKSVLVSPQDPRYADAFQLLGVTRGCTFEQTKAAYYE